MPVLGSDSKSLVDQFSGHWNVPLTENFRPGPPSSAMTQCRVRASDVNVALWITSERFDYTERRPLLFHLTAKIMKLINTHARIMRPDAEAPLQASDEVGVE